MKKLRPRVHTPLLISLAGLALLTLILSGCEMDNTFGSGGVLYSYTITGVSGNGQTVAAGDDESDPIIVRVYLNDSPTSGITVEWNITEGEGALSSDSGVSDADGEVQTTYISGNTTGDVKIVATVNFDSSGFENFAGRAVIPVTFTLKVVEAADNSSE